MFLDLDLLLSFKKQSFSSKIEMKLHFRRIYFLARRLDSRTGGVWFAGAFVY